MCSSTVSALTILNTQHAYARGKAIGSVVIIVVIICRGHKNHQIWRSRHLSELYRNKSVAFGKKTGISVLRIK